MYAAINQWSFPEMELRAMIKLASQAGYAGFEPAFGVQGTLTPGTPPSVLRELGSLAEDCGIRLTSLASAEYWQRQMVSPDKAVRDRAWSFLLRHLDAARELGVSAILVVPGVVDENTPYDAAYDRTVEFLVRAAPEAKAAKVDILVENVWNNFLLSPLEARSLLDQVASPSVGFYLDLGNVVKYGYPEQWIRILGSRIRRVHVKDYRRACGTMEGFVDLLAGDVDFPACVDALSRIGYNGPLIAEMGGYRHYGDEVVFRTRAALERILRG